MFYKKGIALLFVFCTFFCVYTMHMNRKQANYINAKSLVIDMGCSPVPDLALAQDILALYPHLVNARDLRHIPGKQGTTALTTAAAHGNLTYVEFLLNHKANIEIKDLWSCRTSLATAALQGHQDTAALLIERKANINAQDHSGFTALIWAASHAKVGIVELLINAQANVNSKDGKGRTALSETQQSLFPQCKDEYAQIEQLLRKGGAQE